MTYPEIFIEKESIHTASEHALTGENDIIFIEKESIHTVSEHALTGECGNSELIDTILGENFIDIEIMCNMQCYLFSLISWIPVFLLLVSAK